jgi:hypothetical protein
LKEMIAFCGLGCHECGAFLATKENNNQKRAKVAKNGLSYLKWISALKILIVTAANLMKGVFLITATFVK